MIPDDHSKFYTKELGNGKTAIVTTRMSGDRSKMQISLQAEDARGRNIEFDIFDSKTVPRELTELKDRIALGFTNKQYVNAETDGDRIYPTILSLCFKGSGENMPLGKDAHDILTGLGLSEKIPYQQTVAKKPRLNTHALRAALGRHCPADGRLLNVLIGEIEGVHHRGQMFDSPQRSR